MKWSARFAGCLMVLLASGCATSGAGIKPGCEWARPIYVSNQDELTDGTARQILEHNEAWERVCAG